MPQDMIVKGLAPGLAVLLTMLAPCPARADLLYFRGGGQVQAPAIVESDRVRIETPLGTHSFRTDDFLKIVSGACPEREWGPRRDAALKAGADARLAAGWWALENGLVTEAVALIRSAHAADPKHEPTARLVAMLDRLNRPTHDPETDRLESALGVSCEREQSPHVLLLHQHDPGEARQRVDLLERVVTAYYLMLAAHGIDLDLPEHRLVSVYLRDRRDYLAFLSSQGAGAFRTTLGYYHPMFRAVVAFDLRSTRAPSHSASDSTSTEPGLVDLRRRRLLRDLDERARDLGTAAHEMVHLLVAESGLAARPGQFPLWLHEGFAAQFEVIRGGRWAGIGRAHDLRLPDWRAITPSPELASLVRDEGFGHGYQRDLYAECWSLVYFLRKTRPDEFLTFRDRLRLPSPSADLSDPARFEAAFRASFGEDVQSLASEWRAFVCSVRTPLEEAAPLDMILDARFHPRRD
jgi:hypothetical protein